MHGIEGRCTLSDLNEQISQALSRHFRTPVWVVAEIASVNDHPSGHVYLDLVEKRDDEILAKAKAQVWRSRHSIIDRFEQTTKKYLSRGMEVLILVQVRFHPVHGLSLDIQDISAEYTLGDLERRRREVVERLFKEKLIERNKKLQFPLVPQRVAVVSSESAAGYHDFRTQLVPNHHRYDYQVELFPAVMQGEEAEASILSAFARIRDQQARFDVVVLIRGGGASLDLTCFDGYELALAVATFPLPVITGIGHEKDGTVVDLVAGEKVPTPTAAAQLLIQRCRTFEEEIEERASAVCAGAKNRLQQSTAELDRTAARFTTEGLRRIGGEKEELSQVIGRLERAVTKELRSGAAQLEALASTLHYQPRLQLERRGRALSDVTLRLRSGSAAAIARRREELRARLDRLGAGCRAAVIAKSRDLDRIVTRVQVRPVVLLEQRAAATESLAREIAAKASAALVRADHELRMLEKSVATGDPKEVLRRGYSITRFQGKALRDAGAVPVGETIESVVASGSILSTVESVREE